jgi:hypothetical protein
MQYRCHLKFDYLFLIEIDMWIHINIKYFEIMTIAELSTNLLNNSTPRNIEKMHKTSRRLVIHNNE